MESKYKPKNRIKIFSLIFTIQSSLIISFMTNILFVYVLFSIESLYKLRGIFLHIGVVALILFSIRNVFYVTAKTSRRLSFLLRGYKVLLTLLIVYYLLLIYLMCNSDVDTNTILFFVFSVLISSIFHGLLTLSISTYVNQNGTKPLISTEKDIDDAMKEVILRSDPM